VSFSGFSTGTKLASKTQKKFKKLSVLDLVPVLRVQKQPKKTFQKTAKMYLVLATNLKNKIKF
jgi:hypothetical protein